MCEFKDCEDELNFVTQDRELTYIELAITINELGDTKLNLAGAEHDLRVANNTIKELVGYLREAANLLSGCCDDEGSLSYNEESVEYHAIADKFDKGDVYKEAHKQGLSDEQKKDKSIMVGSISGRELNNE